MPPSTPDDVDVDIDVDVAVDVDVDVDVAVDVDVDVDDLNWVSGLRHRIRLPYGVLFSPSSRTLNAARMLPTAPRHPGACLLGVVQ